MRIKTWNDNPVNGLNSFPEVVARTNGSFDLKTVFNLENSQNEIQFKYNNLLIDLFLHLE